MDDQPLRKPRADSALREYARTGAGAEQVEVVVVHTTLEATRHAMDTVLQLARDLNARIRLLAPQVVPYPLPLERPPVSPRFLAEQLLPATGALHTIVDIRLGRDLWDILKSVLVPNSLIVMGGRRWPWGERRLAARLRQEGHNVLFVPLH